MVWGELSEQYQLRFGILVTPDDGVLVELVAEDARSLQCQAKDQAAGFTRPVRVLADTHPLNKDQAAGSKVSHEVEVPLGIDGGRQLLAKGVAGADERGAIAAVVLVKLEKGLAWLAYLQRERHWAVHLIVGLAIRVEKMCGDAGIRQNGPLFKGRRSGLVTLASHIAFSANHLAPLAGWCGRLPNSKCRKSINGLRKRCNGQPLGRNLHKSRLLIPVYGETQMLCLLKASHVLF